MEVGTADEFDNMRRVLAQVLPTCATGLLQALTGSTYELF